MGSIAKKTLRILLSAVIAVSMTPTLALASNDGASGSSSGKGESINVAHDINGGSAEQVDVPADVNLVGYDDTPADAFQIVDRQDPVMLSSISKTDTVWVAVVNGVGPYEVSWTRIAADADVDGSTPTDVSAPSVGEGSSFPADSNNKDETTGYEVFSHYLGNDTFEDDTTYNYYVTITDKGANPEASVSTYEPSKSPIKVSVGSINYDHGPLVWESLLKPIWRIDGDNGLDGGDWNGVGGLIRKGATLSVTQYDTATSQAGSADYGVIASQAASNGFKIAGSKTTGSGSGAVTTTGTAAWNLTISTNVPEGSSDVEAFLEDLLVTLDAKQILDVLGFESLPEDFADRYQLMHAGGKGVSFGMPMVNDDGTITFTIEGTTSFNSGSLGVFALVCAIEADDEAFAITPKVNGSGGQISPFVSKTYAPGASPIFTFTPDSGADKYEVAYVDVFVSGESTPRIHEVYNDRATTPPVTSVSNSFTFPTNWSDKTDPSGPCYDIYQSEGEIPDAVLVVSFSKIPTPAQSAYKVRVVGDTHGDVTIQGKGADGSSLIDTIHGSLMGATSYKDYPMLAGESIELVFNPYLGYPQIKLMALASIGDGAKPEDFTQIQVKGSSYTVPSLTSDMTFAVTFEEANVETYNYYTVSAEVTTGTDTGTALFANGETTKSVQEGEGCSFIVTPAEGHEFESARIYYMGADGSYIPGPDVTSNFEAATNSKAGALAISDVLCDTVVRFSFKKSSSSSEGGSGVVEPPATANVRIVGATDVNGNALPAGSWSYDTTNPVAGEWVSMPAAYATHTFPIGYQQTFSFFYYSLKDSSSTPAKPIWWVIDRLNIDYLDKDGNVTSTFNPNMVETTNHARLDITGNMKISVVLRAPRSDESTGNVADPGDISTGEPQPPVVPGGTVTTDPGTGQTTITIGGSGSDPSDQPVNSKGDPIDVEIAVDPDDPSKAAVDSSKPTVQSGPHAGEPNYTGRYDEYGEVITKPNAEETYIDPATGEIKTSTIPFVDSKGTIVGEGGAYDPIEDSWKPGGSVVVYPSAPGDPVVVQIAPDSSEESEPYVWDVEKVWIDGAALIPYELLDAAHPEQGNGTFTYDATTGKGEFLDENGLPTGETFTYDPATGILVLEESHAVQASFERKVPVEVDVELSSNRGQAAANVSSWKLFQAGNVVRVTIAPERGYKLLHFWVNGVDCKSEMANDVTEEEFASLLTMGNVSIGARSASLQNERQASLSEWALGAKEAYADEAETAGGLARAGRNLVKEAAQSYTIDLKRYYQTLVGEDARSATSKKIIVTADFVKDEQGGGPSDPQNPIDPSNPSNPSNPNNPSKPDDSIYWVMTATVAAGQGSIDGEQNIVKPIPDGSYYDLTFAPAPGWQVVKVVDNGTEYTWTRNTYRVDNVTSNRTIEVTFAMIGASGDNSGSGRILRRISAMVNTGDAALPLMFVALGVALGAAGVATFIGGKRRRRDD